MKMLKKISVLLLVIALGLSSVLNVSAQTSDKYSVHLGQAVSIDSQMEGVWQSASALNEGASSVYYAFENKNDNKFLRLANFNSSIFSTYTTVNFAIDYFAQWKSVVSLKFNYRLSEGVDPYRANDRIATVSVGGVEKHITYGDLVCTEQGNYDWQTYSVSLSVTQSDKADRLVLTYYYDGAKKNSDTSRYLDVDNIEISSGTTVLGAHDLQFAPASLSDKVIFSFDYSNETVENKSSLMLYGSDALNYSENTTYNKSQSVVFGGSDVASALPHAGNYIYRGATSVKAGESDLYVLYDKVAENSFLRLGNFNGASGVTDSRFTMNFYNNQAKAIENMPVTNRVFFSFKYRLYASEEILNTFDLTQNVLQFSTRSASNNNSGYVSFDELIINEPGDDTWHTYHGVMETLTTTTANIAIYYFGYEQASLSPQIYLDMDDLTLSPHNSDANYAYLNGGFEGLVATVSGGDDPFNSYVFNNPILGGSAKKIRVGANDFGMQIAKGQSFSISLGWAPKTDVYHVSFDTLCNSGSLRMYFGGISGKYIDLTIGTNSGAMGDPLSVHWNKTENGYECNLYFTRLVNTNIYSLDFVNTGNSEIVIDNIFVGEVKAVNTDKGDYQAFITQLEELRAAYEAGVANYRNSVQKSLKQAFYNADCITEYSSASRMQNAIKSISDLLNTAGKKSNLDELNATIERAEKLFENGGADLYTRATWITFEKAYVSAKNITCENTQSKVNTANSNLEAAMLSLVPIDESRNGSAVAMLALQIGGVGVGIGSLAWATAYTVRRRRKNEK